MQYGIQKNGQPGHVEAEHILLNALDAGINCFDTAAAYGEAEHILGNFALQYPKKAKEMNIISKLSPNAFQNVPHEKWKTVAVQQAKVSLKRIGAEQLTAYLFHNASYIFDTAAVDALDCVRKEGLAQQIGVSVYSPEEAVRALEYPQIGVIQVPYNVFDQRLDRCNFFTMAKKRCVQIFARSSLLQGLAIMQPSELPAHMAFAAPYLSSFLEICNRYDISPLHAAVSYVVSHPCIDYVVFGVDSSRQLSEYLAATKMELPSPIRNVFINAFREVDKKLVNPSLWNEQS